MFDFHKIADGLYTLFRRGQRITEIPLTRDELDEALLDLPMSDAEVAFVDAFYGEDA